ncbi:MAG: mannitol dehydrogenase family protein [Emcibacter sp.]|nr:mannitol dehydrogenase family protein [Emcibacter sp.]
MTPPIRLTSTSLAHCPSSLHGPGYNPSAYGVGMVHLGIGAFHRAHQAEFTNRVLAKYGGDWRSVGVSLRSGAVRDQLSPQDGLYTLAVKNGVVTAYSVIGSVADVLVAPENPQAVVELLSDEKIKIVTLTITEKGYCQDPSTNRLNLSHPFIQHDLANLNHPKSALGFLVAALKVRFQTHQQPLTIISCDNLPSNGRVLEALLLQFAENTDPALARWIKDNIAFPETMVDRIVPATLVEDRAEFTNATNLIDEGLVKGEPFSQWLIEDKFATPHPEWQHVGVQFVADVQPYEEAKLRMLNGSHSALAYLGYLAGYTFIHETMANPDFNGFADHLMRREAAPSLTPPKELDLEFYAGELKARYENAALQHKTHQIAMDGSQKLPQRLLGIIRHNLKNDLSYTACCLAVAAWMRYVMGTDEQGKPIDVQDPLAEKFKKIALQNGNDPQKLVASYLAVREVFTEDMQHQTAFREKLVLCLGQLLTDGSKKTVADFMQKRKP